MDRNTNTDLQAPATGAAAELAAGMGGSYAIDPASGSVTLNHRTQAARVSKRAPETMPGAPAQQQPAVDDEPSEPA